jgi:hypothetical protein
MIRNEVRQLDASMPVYGVKTLEAQLDETLLTDRLIALLSAGFGLLATVLASIGLLRGRQNRQRADRPRPAPAGV